jgi:hypothetical protein
VGGVKRPLALAELDLIDEYEFVVQPKVAGHGPTLLAGLPDHIDLKLVSRLEFGSGAVVMRYEPRRQQKDFGRGFTCAGTSFPSRRDRLLRVRPRGIPDAEVSKRGLQVDTWTPMTRPVNRRPIRGRERRSRLARAR